MVELQSAYDSRRIINKKGFQYCFVFVYTAHLKLFKLKGELRNEVKCKKNKCCTFTILSKFSRLAISQLSSRVSISISAALNTTSSFRPLTSLSLLSFGSFNTIKCSFIADTLC